MRGGRTGELQSRLGVGGAGDPPERLGKLRNVKKLAMGMYFGVALTESGEVYHWGDFTYGGVRHFGRAIQKDVTYDIEKGIRPVAHGVPDERGEKRLNVRLTRVARGYDVRDVIVSGHHTCLRLGDGRLLCEWLLGKMPFDIREVWPDVAFEAGEEISIGTDTGR
jgi:hypothetical protein